MWGRVVGGGLLLGIPRQNGGKICNLRRNQYKVRATKILATSRKSRTQKAAELYALSCHFFAGHRQTTPHKQYNHVLRRRPIRTLCRHARRRRLAKRRHGRPRRWGRRHNQVVRDVGCEFIAAACCLHAAAVSK